MKRLLLLLLTISLITSCATSGEDSLSKYSKADINFAEMMIPHHEQALEMVAIAQTNTTNEEILALAEQIRGAQEPEIVLMKSWPGVDVSKHEGHSMSGMLSDSEMEKLAAAKGAEFDRLFLEGMIKHHEGAIDMAKEVVDSKNQSVMKLAEWIVNVQALEIENMRALLGKK